MPKDLRKRGKRHKKPSAEDQTHAQEHEVLDEGPSGGPSWIVPRADSSSKQFNPEAPFGYVDPELKLEGLFQNRRRSIEGMAAEPELRVGRRGCRSK